MKLRIQAQHLQLGDIVGSGEIVISNPQAGIKTAKGKVEVLLETDRYVDGSKIFTRLAVWGKYTMINIDRPDNTKEDLPSVSRASHYS